MYSDENMTLRPSAIKTNLVHVHACTCKHANSMSGQVRVFNVHIQSKLVAVPLSGTGKMAGRE